MSLPNVIPNKEHYAKAVCMFLAEMLRTRKAPIHRCAEIAQKVIQNINLVDTERDFLKLIKELSRDFEELTHLEQRVFMHIQIDEHRGLEQKIIEYVIFILLQDPHQASQVLQEAIKPGITHEHICGQFPGFKQFTEIKHEQPRV